jgi:hypothetical protein
MVVAECAAPTVEKIGSKYQDDIARAIRANEQGNPKPIRSGSILD